MFSPLPPKKKWLQIVKKKRQQIGKNWFKLVARTIVILNLTQVYILNRFERCITQCFYCELWSWRKRKFEKKLFRRFCINGRVENFGKFFFWLETKFRMRNTWQCDQQQCDRNNDDGKKVLADVWWKLFTVKSSKVFSLFSFRKICFVFFSEVFLEFCFVLKGLFNGQFSNGYLKGGKVLYSYYEINIYKLYLLWLM